MEYLMENTKISCGNCGATFVSKFFTGGALEHDNVISNLEVFISKYNVTDNEFFFSANPSE